MPGPSSVLSVNEKIVLRSGYVFCRSRRKPYKREARLADLRRVNPIPRPLRVMKLSAAMSFTRNISIRSFLSLKVSPCIESNAISQELLGYLKKFVSDKTGLKKKTSFRTRLESVHHLIRGTNAETAVNLKDLTASKNTSLIELTNIVLEMVRKKMQFTRKGNRTACMGLEEFDYQVDQGRLPFNISAVLYGKGRLTVMTIHSDHWAMFAVAIVIIYESRSGNLCIPELNATEPSREGTILLINPTTLHSVPFVARETNRIVIIFAM